MSMSSPVVTAGVVILGPPIFLTLFLTYHGIGCYTNKSKRQEATRGALGLKGRRQLEHAVGNLQPHKTVDCWIKSLPRSAKVTLKRVQRVVEEQHSIKVECVGSAQDILGWEHWLVCVDHEVRATSWGYFSGLLVGSLRFIAGAVTEGHIDEFRINGRLVAWSSMMAKGKTMRNMWFYQRTEACKCLLWFYTVRLAVERCLDMELNHLDLGPSHKEDVRELKAKYGFQSTLHWNQDTACPDSDPRFHCDYSGSYVNLT